MKGIQGVTMKDEFEPAPQVYLAVTVPKFPNYFVVNGVRGSKNSLLLSLTADSRQATGHKAPHFHL